MGQVAVTIAGKSYRMACDDGQEAHLDALARTVDSKIAQLRTAFGEIGDLRLTVMAAIAIADDVNEQSSRLGALEAEMEALRRQLTAADNETLRKQKDVGRAIDRLAERVERISDIVDGKAEA
jgi:cell division protein ZapA